jgi:hypothetical protein
MTELESNQTLNPPCKDKIKKDLESFKLGMNNIIYQVSIGMDGKIWCALIGQSLQDGIAGFGSSLQDALRDLANKIG